MLRLIARTYNNSKDHNRNNSRRTIRGTVDCGKPLGSSTLMLRLIAGTYNNSKDNNRNNGRRTIRRTVDFSEGDFERMTSRAELTRS